MLGSHDSFTYLKSEDWFTRILSPFWKCQSLSLRQQYDRGVRFFDIRINRNYKKGLLNKIFNRYDNVSYWTVGHGIAELKDCPELKFNNIEDICKYFLENFNDCYYRIILERGNNEDKQDFKEQIIGLENKYFGLCWYGIKKPWITLFYNPPFNKVNELSCKLFNIDVEKSFWHNIKQFKLSYIIKTYAKKHNPIITDKILEDKDTLLLLDYVEIENEKT